MCQCARCICLEIIADGECESLPCGHVLHTECLNRWCSISGKPKAAACPFKCYQNMDIAAQEASLLASASGASGSGQQPLSSTIIDADDVEEEIDVDEEDQPITR